MTRTATVEELDDELAAQAAVAQRALASEQEQLYASRALVAGLQSEMAAVREELRRTRAELQWLRRAGIDLNRLMEHPVARVVRGSARGARSVARAARRVRRVVS